MLTEQKRYLFPLYLLLNICFAILFCVAGLFIPGLSEANTTPDKFSAGLWGWLLYYLIPVLILLYTLSHKVWFDSARQAVNLWQIRAALLVLILVGAMICVGISWDIAAVGLSFRVISDAATGHMVYMALGYCFSAGMLILLKRCMTWFVKKNRATSNLIKSVLIVGTGERARTIAQKIDAHPQWGMRVAGHITHARGDVTGHGIVGTVHDLGGVLQNNIADMVLIAADRSYLSHIDNIIQRCCLEGVDVGFVTGLNLTFSPGIVVEQFNDVRFCIFKPVYHRPEILFLKRLLDLTASAVLCCLSLPIWVVVPLLIRNDSPGPILFRQERVGKNGRLFIMYKFRSMVVDAESRRRELLHLNEMNGPAFKLKQDPRTTRIGKFLRTTSIDELPQLFNVLKGDISLVGPRPALLEEVRQYRPWEKRRLSVRQGITGFWQVSGRNDLKFDEWMKLDLMYIDQWRFLVDLIILIKTVPAVIAQKGAH